MKLSPRVRERGINSRLQPRLAYRVYRPYEMDVDIIYFFKLYKKLHMLKTGRLDLYSIRCDKAKSTAFVTW